RILGTMPPTAALPARREKGGPPRTARDAVFAAGSRSVIKGSRPRGRISDSKTRSTVMGRQSFAALGVVALIAHLSMAMSVGLVAQAKTIALSSIKRIYVDKMDNDLDQYIRAEIQKQFKGSVQV